MARDLYQEITDKVVAAIEAGALGSYEMPWHAMGRFGNPVNMTTGAAYRGVNVLMLSMSASAAAYPVNAWGSYQQWLGKGGQVRKGERGTMIVYAGNVVKEGDADANGEATVHRFGFLRHSTVFNVSQVEGVELPVVERPAAVDRIAAADQIVSDTGAVIRSGGDRAFYSPGADFIAMPDADAFKATSTRTATESYYGVLFHELTHWTGADKRLARVFGKRFGDEAYAAGELVAEMSAAFLCARVGISAEFREDHARYVASWLKALKNDKRAIFTAAARASDASDYILAGAAHPVAVAA